MGKGQPARIETGPIRENSCPAPFVNPGRHASYAVIQAPIPDLGLPGMGLTPIRDEVSGSRTIAL